MLVSSAEFSKCGKYRYRLIRCWDESLPQLLFIGLNPSKADASHNDPTIKRCIQFAKSWGFGGFTIINLYAYKATQPSKLFQAKRPIGPKNEQVITEEIYSGKKIVLIWGNHALKNNRDQEVLQFIEEAFCLKINKSGSPAHPLYIKKSQTLIPYKLDRISSE